MKRAAANDAASIYILANHYHHGNGGLQQDHAKSMELYARAGQLGCSKAHGNLGGIYRQRGDSKKSKFHYEATAMAGDEVARCAIGNIDGNSGIIEGDSTLTAYNNSCAEMRSEARDN